MSPEEGAAAGVLVRLRRELAHDRGALERHVTDAVTLLAGWKQTPASRVEPSRAELALAAVALHAWYTGLEVILERIIRRLDQAVPAGDTSHRELLFQATAEVPRLRPTILPESLTSDLLELLAFRHFFRHAYAVDLDPDELAEHLDRLVELHPLVSTALEAFDRFLMQSVDELTGK